MGTTRTPGEPAGGAVTLEAVARHAGVSRQTVSNAVNAPDRLRPETLDRVLRAVGELGYRANRNARSLRTRASRLIGFRIDPTVSSGADSLLDHFLHELARGAQERGYHILVFTPTDPADDLSGYDDLLRSMAVDAFVIAATHQRDERLAWLREQGAPFVAFGRPWEPGAEHPWVDVDGAAGTSAAVEHLVEEGHRRIAYVGWPAGSEVGEDRRQGWQRAMRRHRLATRGLAVEVPDGLEPGRAAATALLDTASPPTGFVCASDQLAAGVLHAVAARGLQAGSDVGVVGFDDSPPARLLRPSLTSVRQPLTEIAAEVVRMIEDLLAGRTPDPPGVVLTPSLVVRGSSRRHAHPLSEGDRP